jgi:fatty acid desaturase
MKQATTTEEQLLALKREIDALGHRELPLSRHLAELAAATLLAYGGALVMSLPLALATPQVWLLRAAGTLASAFGLVALSTQGHTASHRAYTGSARWDQAVTNFCFPVSLGLSGTYWYYKHIRKHHQAPNVMHWDRDLDLDAPFTVLDRRYATAPKWLRRFYRVQWLTLPIALLFTSFSAQKDGVRYLFKSFVERRGPARRRIVDLALLLLHWTLWLALPAALFGPGVAFGAYLARMLVTSYLIFCTFAPAHFPVEAVALTSDFRAYDFVERQVWTTLNFRTGPIGRFLCAGVEYQIEHHLFPRLSHTVYPRISGLVQKFCEERGCPYRTLPWGRGVWLSLKAFYSLKVVHEQLPPRASFLELPRSDLDRVSEASPASLESTVGGGLS